jgi:uncharacterized protein YbjT (DUF2867 family)
MILITGATGTVGGEVLRQVRQAAGGERAPGGAVRVLVRNAAKAAGLRAPGIELVEGDLLDPRSLEAALTGVDRAFLLPPNDRRAGEGCRAFIEAAGVAGIRHVVKLSALNAGPEAPSAILREHAAVDDALVRSGLAWTILRPNSFMQNLLGQAAAIQTGAPSTSPSATPG